MPRGRTKPSSDDEAEVIRRVVRERKLPSSVRGFELEFGDDSTGSPAVWIWFEVEDDPAPSKRKQKEINELARSVTADLLKSGLARWPYVRFRVPVQAGGAGGPAR